MDGQYMDFTSFCPMQYKRALVHTLYYWATKICTPDKLAAEIELLKNVLRSNNYPEQFIEKHFKLNNKMDTLTTVPKNRFI